MDAKSTAASTAANDALKFLEEKKAREATEAKSGTGQPVNREATKSVWTADMAKSMAWSLFGFTALVLILATMLLWKRNVSSAQIVRLFLLALIVSMASFLLVVGYDESQLTPVIGLFGAISGYLLGRESSSNNRPPGETPAE